MTVTFSGLTSLGSAWAAQATGDVSAWQTEGEQVASAAENEIQNDASAAQGLVGQVVSAEVGLASQLASAGDATAKKLDAAAVAAIDGWSGDAKTDAQNDINAAVPVIQQLDQDALTCEEGCVSAGLTDANDQWSQWLARSRRTTAMRLSAGTRWRAIWTRPSTPWTSRADGHGRPGAAGLQPGGGPARRTDVVRQQHPVADEHHGPDRPSERQPGEQHRPAAEWNHAVAR